MRTIDRHRALDGLFRRLDRHPVGASWVVRGGMAIRQGHRTRRVVRDLDLVARERFDLASLADGFGAAAHQHLDDGVTFDALRVEPRWRGPHRQDAGMGVGGWVDGRPVTLGVDLAVGVDVGVTQPMGRLHLADPVTMAARKLTLLVRLGSARWRPKDLFDAYTLVVEDALDLGRLGAALERALGVTGTVAEALRVPTQVRWARFVQADAPGAPLDVREPCDDLRHALSPLLTRRR